MTDLQEGILEIFVEAARYRQSRHNVTAEWIAHQTNRVTEWKREARKFDATFVKKEHAYDSARKKAKRLDPVWRAKDLARKVAYRKKKASQ